MLTHHFCAKTGHPPTTLTDSRGVHIVRRGGRGGGHPPSGPPAWQVLPLAQVQARVSEPTRCFRNYLVIAAAVTSGRYQGVRCHACSSIVPQVNEKTEHAAAAVTPGRAWVLVFSRKRKPRKIGDEAARGRERLQLRRRAGRESCPF